MTEAETKQKGLELVGKSDIAMLATVDAEGYPEVRAMLKMEHDGLKEFWFTTNTSSRKIPQLKTNSKACLYFVDMEHYMGLSLIGMVEIHCDQKSKQRLWREGFEKYYPEGIDDPDYCVLRFKAVSGEYYHKLQTVRFAV